MIGDSKSSSMRNAFSPQPDDMPEVLPVFPQHNVLLLPGGRMPLNMFEPRYLEMVRDQLATPLRLIGIVQSAPGREKGASAPLRETGCAGKIIHFTEHDDRYLLMLAGTCRFTISDEIDPRNGYRRVRPDWSSHLQDLYLDQKDYPKIDRPLLKRKLRAYLERMGLSANWEAIGTTEDPALITSLAMMCPFSAEEKQALLEADCPPELTKMLYSLLDFGIHEGNPSESRH